jgi:hypothetical protein
MFIKAILVSGIAALGSTHSTGALAASFDIDFEAARVAGSGCRLGENAFLESAGPNAVELDLGGLRASVGSFDGDAGSARSTCAVALPGRLPRGFTLRSVRSQGRYNVLKSASSNLRLATTVIGAGVHAPVAQLSFDKGRSAFAQSAAFSLVNTVEDDGALCNPSRSEDVTLTVLLTASAQKGTQQSYAELEVASGQGVRVSFEIQPCH